MNWIVQYLWLIPALPLVAAGIIAVNKQPQRKLAASLAIGSMAIGFLLSLCALSATFGHGRRRCTRSVQFPLDSIWRPMDEHWLGAGSADGHHAGDGDVRGHADFHLQRRLHGARPEFHAVLLFPGAVRVGHARRGHRQQLVPAFRLVGNRRADQLSADRFLVSQAQRGGGGQEGLHHHAHRRPRPVARHGLALRANRHAEFLRSRPGLHGNHRAFGMVDACHRRRDGGDHGHRPADLSGRGWQIRPGAAARLAAGCDGRPHAGQRADPCGHDGGRRRVPRRARLSADGRRRRRLDTARP